MTEDLFQFFQRPFRTKSKSFVNDAVRRKNREVFVTEFVSASPLKVLKVLQAQSKPFHEVSEIGVFVQRFVFANETVVPALTMPAVQCRNQ